MGAREAIATTGQVRDARATSATRIVVGTFGLYLGAAGVEHGIGEMVQGPIAPASFMIQSWAGTPAFDIVNGEPAMTVIPNLLITGIVAVLVGVAVAVWSVGYAHRPPGGPVLILLSILLLLVGGGLAPPLMGVILGIAAARIGIAGRRPPGSAARRIARVWPWALAAGVLGYVGLFPGMVIASVLFDVNDPGLVIVLAVLAFGGLFASLIAARASDRVQLAHGA